MGSKNIIKPNEERVLVVGGPANGQSHYVEAGSDILKIQSPVSEAGVITGKPIEYVYKIRKLRIPDPVTNRQDTFRIAMHEEAPLGQAFNALFVMFHLGQVGGTTQMPENLRTALWPEAN